MTFIFQPINDWNVAPSSEPEQNGATLTQQLTNTAAKGQDDTRK